RNGSRAAHACSRFWVTFAVASTAVSGPTRLRRNCCRVPTRIGQSPLHLRCQLLEQLPRERVERRRPGRAVPPECTLLTACLKQASCRPGLLAGGLQPLPHTQLPGDQLLPLVDRQGRQHSEQASASCSHQGGGRVAAADSGLPLWSRKVMRSVPSGNVSVP